MPADEPAADQQARLDQATSLPDLFGRVARVYATLEAVRAGDRSMSYAELERLSDHLASRLVEHGVRPGDRVGLLLDRTAEQPVAVLGVLKAGAAFVPLDLAFPAARSAFLIEDAGIEVVVNADGGPVAGLSGVRTVAAEAAEAAGPAPRVAVTGTDLAYVIYTSGSTGTPKGCMITHASVLAFLGGVLTRFDLGPDDRIAQFHPFVFDASVWELWAALATGATAVMAPTEATRSLPDFLALLVRESVTFNSQVPTSFRALVEAYDSAGRPPLALRYLVLGGEPVQLDVVERFLRLHPAPGPTVVNVYGPTEATCITTCHVLGPDEVANPVRSPIGTALPHLRAEVRDEALLPVADGRVGELVVAGTGLALGYIGQPDLTAERFVVLDGPSGPDRYYRTGDLVRRLPDGSFDYIGRNDEQIKVRGVRIELGEVEAAVRSSPLVAAAAATVVNTALGGQFLVACVVLTDDARDLRPLDVDDQLREHLLEIVPRFLVPDRFTHLPRLPMTDSQKIDRRALQELARPRRAVGADQR